MCIIISGSSKRVTTMYYLDSVLRFAFPSDSTGTERSEKRVHAMASRLVVLAKGSFTYYVNQGRGREGGGLESLVLFYSLECRKWITRGGGLKWIQIGLRDM